MEGGSFSDERVVGWWWVGFEESVTARASDQILGLRP